MSLIGALSIANSGINSINEGLSLVSQNVANANDVGYETETESNSALVAGAQPAGIQSGQVLISSDPGLQTSVYNANSSASQWSTTNQALSSISPALGSVGSGNDLGSLLGNVQSAFGALLSNPSSQSQQQSAVQAAESLTSGINQLSGSYANAEQSAQNQLVSTVGQLNTALQQLGNYNSQIVALSGSSNSVASLENQRNAVMQTISNLIPVNYVTQPNGSVNVFAGNGVQLPTTGTSPALSVASVTTSAQSYYPGGGLPGIMLGNTDITANITGGQIGALVQLRDQTIPQFQAQLDQFSQTLASRFSAQGLNLFTDGSGNVPTGGGTPTQNGYVGFSSLIQVNPAVQANPQLVVDGTQAVVGSPTGASSFTPNPSNGPSGFTTMISRVLNYAMTDQVQAGVAQPTIATTGLGPGGNLSVSMNGNTDVLSFANTLTAGQSAVISDATTQSTDASSVQSSLTGSLTLATGVSMDQQMSEMIALQNSYGANAKVISTVQAMMSTVINMVQ